VQGIFLAQTSGLSCVNVVISAKQPSKNKKRRWTTDFFPSLISYVRLNEVHHTSLYYCYSNNNDDDDDDDIAYCRRWQCGCFLIMKDKHAFWRHQWKEEGEEKKKKKKKKCREKGRTKRRKTFILSWQIIS